LLAVHAQKSAAAVLAFASRHPGQPIAVLLAGTELNAPGGLPADALAALRAASRILALQPNASAALPAGLAAKVRTIVQSATAVSRPRVTDAFQVCMLAHLRAVKAPLLAAAALAAIDPGIRIRVQLAGEALEPGLADAARAAMAADRRFRWLGPLRRRQALTLLAESHACLVPSISEGGANVVSEAIACGTPVLGSRIAGNSGLLGDDWPGLFDSGDAGQLAALMTRAANDGAFYAELAARTRALQPMVQPEREREAFRALLQELLPPVR
jgi:glycosyltransferase involved in cell wall biosynthesis